MTTAFVYTATENVDSDEIQALLSASHEFADDDLLVILVVDPEDLRKHQTEVIEDATSEVVEYASALHHDTCADVYFHQCDHYVIEKIVMNFLRRGSNVRLRITQPRVQLRRAG